MPKRTIGTDPLFLKAEQLAREYARFPRSEQDVAPLIHGVLSDEEIEARLDDLRRIDVDTYVSQTVFPSEDAKRPSAKSVLRRLPGRRYSEQEIGPLYALEMDMDLGHGDIRRVGIIAQDRNSNNGVWMPEHHVQAAGMVRRLASNSMPIVTFIDTPGADAGAEANLHNQAHSISELIAEFALVDVPVVGIIFGNGYSGGAIPLATANVLLSVRDGVFNTIHPSGLASIARKYELSWQECAKYVGVSSYELYKQGYLDGIIDYVPGEKEKLPNLIDAIRSGILATEQRAREFVAQSPEVVDHYLRSVQRFIDPSEPLRKFQEQSSLGRYDNPTEHINVFGAAYRYLRYLGMRQRIRSTTMERYGRLSNASVPRGDLPERTEREHQQTFRTWLESPLEIKYDDSLSKAWNQFRDRSSELQDDRGPLTRFLFGDPQSNYRQAYRNLLLTYGFHLYNQWKAASQSNFIALIEHLRTGARPLPSESGDITVLDIISRTDVRADFIRECENFLLLDQIYNNIVQDLKSIAREARDTNTISRQSVRILLEESLRKATDDLLRARPDVAEGDAKQEELQYQFISWLNHFVRHRNRGRFLKSVEQWKRIVFPRVSEPLLAIITFIFERLLPQYYASVGGQNAYDGTINPRNIGIRDFWNRLTIAYQDLLIDDEFQRIKQKKLVTTRGIMDRFVAEFEELDANLMTADPVKFPGFRISIEQALNRGIRPCGAISGIARLKHRDIRRRVGLLVSNLDFQAGAFDMASAEKLCNLLVECSRRRLPIVCFISSGGMQTKEGAGALFPMPVVNDRITRFVRDNDLPVLVFAFGDCTGGAQASLVTHPLVQNYYFSCTNMPFAGQIVVPAHLPLASTLSNYLSMVPGAMKGMVRHPFVPGLDDTLRGIDPEIPVPKESVEDVIERVLNMVLEPEEPAPRAERESATDLELMRPFERVVVHSRGCPAVKIVGKVQEAGYGVVLVQSDPDMDSVAADLLRRDVDKLICIGGSTPDESYLNAGSIVRIVEREKVEALHPGIGFLSESSDFAALCRSRGINFIGPPVESMILMGNKSNAINTAKRIGVPVVPGSHGIVTDPALAAATAEEIGYPVIMKAVYGGGGKGIKVVHDPRNLQPAFMTIMAEARSAFGNSDIYLEKYITSLRHVEVQVLRDKEGNTRVLGLRDCTVQRNNQKIVEESGCTMLPGSMEKTLYDYAARITDIIGYVGAGTVEFIYDLETKAVYFMEMNTRLQIEHPVTEQITGIDIVLQQLRTASGGSIADLEYKPDGYAVEVRVNAERAGLDFGGELAFIPSPGEITEYRFPKEDGIEVLSSVGKGKTVSPYYDSMIMQIIAKGRDRADAIDRLRRYLDRVVIQGVCTNIPLLKRILSDPVFRTGEYDTSFLKGFVQRIDLEDLVDEIGLASGSSGKALDREELRIEGSTELKVLAPSPGVFYLSPNPNEPEFVRVGDIVDTQHTLCFLEAMKLFRPLHLSSYNQEGAEIYDSTMQWEVVRVVPGHGQAVNKDDLLFVVRPAV